MADEARPVLTFDMDGVLCRPPFGINPGSGKNKRRDTAGKGGIMWHSERVRYLWRKPMPGAVTGFQALAATYDCHVVTARGEGARGVAANWLKRYLGVAPDLYVRPHWRETSAQYKARQVVALNPFAHFEDDPFTAQWLSELIPAVFLIDWPRNRWLEGANIYRIREIGEAAPVLAKLLAPRPA
ncbi:hypothetical protein AYO38_10200 [bacterium SCGC AG-212-C10]|nr:hypothetical protein AYO38_10200 [bacterium SCGC AG-212-C10]